MNIPPLKALIPASFEYKYLDAADVDQTETIELQLSRMSFGQTVSKDFKDAMEQVGEDAGPISRILAGLIDSWNLDIDGEVFESSADNIASLPPDFVAQLAECVFKRLFPNPQTAKTLPDGLAQKESSQAAATS